MTATDTRSDLTVGLFLASYEIGSGMPGAPMLHVTMTVDTPGESIAGLSHVTQAVNPPLDVASRLSGDFTYMTVMPQRTSILVTATGYPQVSWPPHGGIGPVLPANLHLRMVLQDDWRAGTANVSYLLADGSGNSLTDVPVRLVPGNVL
jgi:hypothetical protein